MSTAATPMGRPTARPSNNILLLAAAVYEESVTKRIPNKPNIFATAYVAGFTALEEHLDVRLDHIDGSVIHAQAVRQRADMTLPAEDVGKRLMGQAIADEVFGRLPTTEEDLTTALLQYAALHTAIAKGYDDIVQLMCGPSRTKCGDAEPSEPIKKKGRRVDKVANGSQSSSTTFRPSPFGHLGWDLTPLAFHGEDGLQKSVWDSVTASAGRWWFRGLITTCNATFDFNALHRACYHGRYEIAKYLIEECGCDPHMPTSVAMRYRNIDIRRLEQYVSFRGWPNRCVYPIQLICGSMTSLMIHAQWGCIDVADRGNPTMSFASLSRCPDPTASPSGEPINRILSVDEWKALIRPYELLLAYLYDEHSCDPNVFAIGYDDGNDPVALMSTLDFVSSNYELNSVFYEKEDPFLLEEEQRVIALSELVPSLFESFCCSPVRESVTLSLPNLRIGYEYSIVSSEIKGSLYGTGRLPCVGIRTSPAYTYSFTGERNVNCARSLLTHKYFAYPDRLLEYIFDVLGWDVDQHVRMDAREGRFGSNYFVDGPLVAHSTRTKFRFATEMHHYPAYTNALIDRGATIDHWAFDHIMHGNHPHWERILPLLDSGVDFMELPFRVMRTPARSHVDLVGLHPFKEFTPFVTTLSGESLDTTLAHDFDTKQFALIFRRLAEHGISPFTLMPYDDDPEYPEENVNVYELARTLQEELPNETIVDQFGLTPLNYVKKAQILEALVAANVASIHHKDIFGRTLLFRATRYNCEILLDHGLSPMTQDNFGMTPLHLAALRSPVYLSALHSSRHCVHYVRDTLAEYATSNYAALYAARGDPDDPLRGLTTFDDGKEQYVVNDDFSCGIIHNNFVRPIAQEEASGALPPMSDADGNANEAFLDELLRRIHLAYTVDINVADPRFGLTPLHMVAMNGNAFTTTDDDDPKPLGGLPLEVNSQSTAAVSHPNSATILPPCANSGFDYITAEEMRPVIPSGSTPMHIAVAKCSADVIKDLLLHPNIDLTITDSLGRTPLHVALEGLRLWVDKLVSVGSTLPPPASEDDFYTPKYMAWDPNRSGSYSGTGVLKTVTQLLEHTIGRLKGPAAYVVHNLSRVIRERNAHDDDDDDDVEGHVPRNERLSAYPAGTLNVTKLTPYGGDVSMHTMGLNEIERIKEYAKSFEGDLASHPPIVRAALAESLKISRLFTQCEGACILLALANP